MSVIQAAKYLQLDQFLNPLRLPTLQGTSRLLDYVLHQESNFVPTTTSTGETDYRKSKILYEFPDLSQWMVQQVEAVLPTVFTQLNHPPFQVSQIEIQLTAHNNGHYYKIPNDNGSAEVARRELSYV
ncbi:MAG: hypothetical protein KME43_02600 [Myxacorys chilensis ATA2-1-KO14]|jgi:Rps23 Pro-64 3,4-dihydroxylase Tpa1-like proline 4-hydroxylase|nr:hypothetical protein [Myxacorys chilensis ATA2-1-KO14]